MSEASLISRNALAASLVAIVVLAAAPFLLASMISERRTATAASATAEIARIIRDTFITDDRARVLVGSGRLPRFDGKSEWLDGPSIPLGRVIEGRTNDGATTDPWRNAYLVNIGAGPNVWVLSAGPNGVVETPYEGASTLRGDDIGAPVR